jgi:hypothetical protein
MSKCPGIDHDPICPTYSLVNGVNQDTFMIGLLATEFHPQAFRPARQFLVNFAQTYPTVDVRLSDSQQVKVWTVQNENFHRVIH